MVKMEHFYRSRSKQELWLEIDKCHMSYLDMEESPEKLEHRNKLEDYIREYLCMVAHYEKFHFPETEEVLDRSARFKKDFSGYKASTGFNAIQLYAGNLLAQPWRKEFRQIKTYCGFYKHQIEANLVGAEILFEALGYDHIGNGLLVMNGPVCMDRVLEVSKDCLIAYVECQILKSIWEDLKVSWLEVLLFRRDHACSPEQAVREIKSRHSRQEHHTRSFSQGSDPYANGRCQPILPLNSQAVTNHSFPPVSHHNVGLPGAEFVYGSAPGGCCQNSYAPALPPCAFYPYAQPQQLLKPQFNLNGYYYNNGFSAPAQHYHQQAVPTAKLIEVEPVHRVKNNNDTPSSDAPDGENWDYVYRNLESQGYSKDLGERGDLLSPNRELNQQPIGGRENNIKQSRVVKSTDLDKCLNNLGLGEEPGKRGQSPASSYENLEPIVDRRKVRELQHEQGQGQDKNRNLEKSGPKPLDSWQCTYCTYLNSKTAEICQICSKSRHKKTEPPMEIGGAECSKCTLVNPKNLKICEACGTSLKDSPTYI